MLSQLLPRHVKPAIRWFGGHSLRPPPSSETQGIQLPRPNIAFRNRAQEICMLSHHLPVQRIPLMNAPGSQIAGGVSSEIGPRLSAAPGCHPITLISRIGRDERTRCLAMRPILRLWAACYRLKSRLSGGGREEIDGGGDRFAIRYEPPSG